MFRVHSKLYQMTEANAERFRLEKDAKRKRYHNTYCEGKWGDSRNYDISINSSKLGEEMTAEMLADYIIKRQNMQ